MKVFKKNQQIKIATVILMGLALMFLTSGIIPGEPWKVPESAKKVKNPVNADKESLSIGKMLYSQHCKSCHGKEGLGDGPKASGLDTECGDFTTNEFKSQTDGELFYKITEGRDEMPTYKKKIPDDEDRWHVVNFIKTLE